MELNTFYQTFHLHYRQISIFAPGLKIQQRIIVTTVTVHEAIGI